jgi:hypothetical protein
MLRAAGVDLPMDQLVRRFDVDQEAAVPAWFSSLDENVSVHEFVNDKLDGATHSGFAGLWVIPGLLAVAVVGFLFVGFLRHLPAKYRRQFLGAAALFLFAAAGLELVGTAIDKPVPPGVDVASLRPRYVDVTESTIEEALEMASVAFFAFSLASYSIELADDDEDGTPTDPEPAVA